MTRWCPWCDRNVPEDDTTIVGAHEPGSATGAPCYACGTCRTVYGIIPLDQHPPGATGAPICVTPRFIGRRDTAPIVRGEPA